MNYFLFEIFGIEFELNISLVITLLTGIALGIVITFLLYLYSALLSLRKSRYIIDNTFVDIKDEDVIKLIEHYKHEYKYRIQDPNLKDTAFTSCVKEEVLQIARWYHPKSKHPMAELTFDELVLLSKYITDRVENIFSNRMLSILRKMKLSTVISLIEVKNSKPVKTINEHKIPEKVKTVMSALNLLNPFHWLKKAIVDNSISIIIKKICLLIIQISGEEAYKVFSRKVLIDENETYRKMFEEIEEEIKREQKEEKRQIKLQQKNNKKSTKENKQKEKVSN